MWERIVRWVNLAALMTMIAMVTAFAIVFAASFYAQPQADLRPVDYEDSPDSVAADVSHNLRAQEYSYDFHVVESGGPWEDEPVTTMKTHTVVDNAARRLRARIQYPVLFEDGDGPAVRLFAESPIGLRYTPASERIQGDSGWSRDGDFGIHPSRNAFDAIETLRGANATVVTDNATTYALRITNDSVAVRVAYPGRPSRYGFGSAGFAGNTLPPTANATANLTIYVDKDADRPTRAVLRYWNPSPGVTADTDDAVSYRSTTTYRFSEYGSVDVDRPLGTYPPSPWTVFFRLDLGVFAIRNANYNRLLVPVVGVLAVGGLLARAFDELGGDPS